MIRVKVCGMIESKNLQKIASMGVDAVGFILAESERQVTLEQAEKLSRDLPPFISRVGVVLNPSHGQLKKIDASNQFDCIQFHGQENPEMLASVSTRTIKAISIENQEDLKDVEKYSEADYLLFDSRNGSRRGGTGEKFNWDYLDSIDPPAPIILAGGLGPDNIIEGISRVKPAAVDLNSRLERKPGIKDPEILQEVLVRLRRHYKHKERGNKTYG
ncbi:phosphoribosylanthranilate isomerase [Halarsenatibacter silvermanii]|uniref:N-(5'-phosphoribosyl)anthranilate isomerase n=1 Tax=Halarsenatibacter silvermanii TaxID=321763 RepID=A0A1G9J5U3_9FIRM|nr:phosphoribosylanthranilate isomerase [Halarsenatibacter silvermanii]SDL32616.1 phosphoribosylanthranilate isomerase [Halarsenatibacter silvermanii]